MLAELRAEARLQPEPVLPRLLQADRQRVRLGWFHKYVVESVTERDLTGGSPDETWSYAYSNQDANDQSMWRHDYSETALLAYRSWPLWQGYTTVTTTHGPAGPNVYAIRSSEGVDVNRAWVSTPHTHIRPRSRFQVVSVQVVFLAARCLRAGGFRTRGMEDDD